MPTSNNPIGAAGYVPRKQRTDELDYYLRKKANDLGKKFAARNNDDDL